MSISALSSNFVSDLSQSRQNTFQQVRQDFKQLATALQSGDLSGAQTAYSSIEKLLQSKPNTSNPSTNSASPIANDLASLSKALQAGDLSQAQSAFAQLQSAIQAGARSSAVVKAKPVAQDQYVPGTSQTTDTAQQVAQDYSQLASALQSGDLTKAQSAFSSLEQTLKAQTGVTATSDTNSTTPTNTADPIANDFSALGKALSAGNLTQAQNAFSQLQSDVQSAEQTVPSQSQGIAQALGSAVSGHHHHHHGGGPEAATATTATTSSAATSPVNLYG